MRVGARFVLVLPSRFRLFHAFLPFCVRPSPQVWVGVVPVGPSGHSLNSSYKNRDSPEYKTELGEPPGPPCPVALWPCPGPALPPPCPFSPWSCAPVPLPSCVGCMVVCEPGCLSAGQLATRPSPPAVRSFLFFAASYSIRRLTPSPLPSSTRQRHRQLLPRSSRRPARLLPLLRRYGRLPLRLEGRGGRLRRYSVGPHLQGAAGLGIVTRLSPPVPTPPWTPACRRGGMRWTTLYGTASPMMYRM